ncbi:MAG: hypothetical protein ACXWPO_03105 [Candidatus Limnocylindrales bacterium]
MLGYFAARCCGGNVTIGDLHPRWGATQERLPDECLPLRAPGDLEAFVQCDLMPVLETARGRIVMRGRGPLRRPAIEVADGHAWLDVIGACWPRSVLRH